MGGAISRRPSAQMICTGIFIGGILGPTLRASKDRFLLPLYNIGSKIAKLPCSVTMQPVVSPPVQLLALLQTPHSHNSALTQPSLSRGIRRDVSTNMAFISRVSVHHRDFSIAGYSTA